MSNQEKKSKTKPAASKSAAKPKQPVEKSGVQDTPMLDSSDAVLGVISKDTPTSDLSASDATVSAPTASAPTAQAPSPTPPTSHRKKGADATGESTAPAGSLSAPSDAAPAPSAEPEPAAPPEPLRLPRGAFVGLRKSGGLKFATREVVVYPDGRVAYDARGVPQKEYTRLRRVMNDGQIISLRKLLDQTNFWKTEGGGKQNPDGFAYEIAAHLNQRSHELEIFDGSIPENLQPLLERLVKLLPA